MKEYTPGQGSYKVEEAGALTGIGTSYDVDNHWGSLVLSRQDVNVPARGIDFSLSSKFNSDHLYSTVIPKVSKNDGPAGGKGVSTPVPRSMMTLPFDQANFYRIANGWSWDLPFLLLGKNIFKYAPGDGKIFDLLSVISQEAWGGIHGGQGNHSWTEGYEVTYGVEDTNTQISVVTIVIPEIQTTIVVNINRSDDLIFDFQPLYDDGLAVYLSDGKVCRFTGNGLIASITDPSGRNTLTYQYVTEVLEGQLVSSSSRKAFCIQPNHYTPVASSDPVTIPGDLVIIGDEIKVVYTRDDGVTHQISTSCNFDVRLPTVGTSADRYKIIKGQLSSITHTDGRAVKFYYAPSGDNRQMTVVLSSDPAIENFAAGDQFLGLYTFTPDNRLLTYQTCEGAGRSARPGDFPSHLAADPSAYFSVLQTLTYRYKITNVPSPTTDQIIVTNTAGASTVYFFQAGGFCSHSWNNAFLHRGTCRRGGNSKAMHIERPDFYINPGDYVNINRIDDNAFWKASKDNYQMDENAAEFQSDNEFNTRMYYAGQALGAGGVMVSLVRQDPIGALMGSTQMTLSAAQYEHQQAKYAQDRALAANAGNVSAWVPVANPGQVNSNRVILDGTLAQDPRQNDVFAVVSASPDKLAKINKTSRNTTRVYVDYTGVNGLTDFQAGDFVFLRTESQVISDVNTEEFSPGVSQRYIEVEHAFSFLPDENEQVMFVYNNGGQLPKISQYYCYYLNKPKVVRVEIQESSAEFSPFVKVIDYEYTYEVQGTTMIDDFDGGGFTEDNVEGPAAQSFDGSDIALKGSAVTTGVRSGSDERDLYKDVYSFSYDEKNFHKGQSSVTRLRLDENSLNWLFVNKTVNQLGRPCFNAGYYGTMASFSFEGGNVNVGDGGSQWRKKIDYRHDVYGRVIRTRVSSPSFEGRRAQSSFTQYVGSSPVIDDVDPLNVFGGNPLSGNYQQIYDRHHALGLVGATIEEVDAQQNTKITYNGYDFDTTNLVVSYSKILPSLRTYQDFLSLNSPNFSGVHDGIRETDPTKVNWSFGAVVNSTDWSAARFDAIRLTAWAVTQYDYDTGTNNLTRITKPHGHVINMAYGESWKSSFVTLDWKTLDQNLDGATQYVVTAYDYDVKGRLISKIVRFKNDHVDSDTNLKTWGASAPKSVTQYTYDGMDRLKTKSVGDGTTQTVVLKRFFEDKGDSLWAHPYMIVTDFLGFRTKTFCDSLYRVISVAKFKPNQPTAGDLDYSPAWEVKTGSTWTVYQPGFDKPAQSIVYTDPDEALAHSVVTKNTYDGIGRLVRVEQKNNDGAYQGDSVFHVVKDIEYDETKNAVITRRYLDGTSDYYQSRVENDWLGRGPIKEIGWTGLNGTGVTRITTSSYRHDGKVLKKTLPNGKSYLYSYDNLGKLEKLVYPDGTRVVMLYDKNQNLIQTINRRNLSTSITYNQSELEISRTTKDADRGDTLVVTTYTPFGPATIVETEGTDDIVRTDLEYHWSGGVSLRKQTSDGHSMQVAYGYDAAGNRISMTPTGSGSSAWTKTLDILPVFHAASPDTDHFNRTAVADNATGKNLVTVEPDYLGLTKTLKYGDYAAPVGQLAYTYDRLLRPITLKSHEATPLMDLTLTRDFTGNIISKVEPAQAPAPAINDVYEYDGMNRLLSGEGEINKYDELSNLVSRGTARYRYQDPDEAGTDQMRLAEFNDGTAQAYTYDADGNVTKIDNRFSALNYDGQGRLRRIESGQQDDYWYDHSGLRIKKTEDTNGSPVTTYTMYEGNNPLMQEVYEGSTRKAVWFQILSGEQILARVGKSYPSTDTTLYFYLDNLGSRRVVLDAAGAVADRYRYSAWGVVTQDVGTDKLASFTGKDYDATGLLYFNARFYDAVTGRFLSEDPARKGSGWYSYCDGNPVNATDPTGLVGQSLGEALGSFFNLDFGKDHFSQAASYASQNSALGYLGAGMELVNGVADAAFTGYLALTGAAEAGLVLGMFGASRQSVAGPTAATSSQTTVRQVPTLRDQAAGLVPMNSGRARVELRSEGMQMRVDLTGKPHNGIPTPHTAIAPRNFQAPESLGPKYNTSEASVRPSSQVDIRTVRRFLEKPQ